MFLDHLPPSEAHGRLLLHAEKPFAPADGRACASSDVVELAADGDDDVPHESAQEQRELAAAALSLQLEAELEVAAPARATSLQAALVSSLLEAVHEPVFVLTAQGGLEQANGVGRAWLRTTEGAEALSTLRAAIAAGGEPGGFALTRIEAPEHEAHHWLARWTLGASLLPSVKVERARQTWNLPERSARVLAQVASGRSNKEIAAALGRSEVTVERHLTSLFRRAGCQSRAELIARLYAL
jgi:DNA-binding NarL/FixJ family response regulator